MKQPRRVTVHVGQTKAGSTSLQNYLENQRTRLVSEDVIFPSSVLVRQNPYDRARTPGHLTLLAKLAKNDLSEFERELAEHPQAQVVLSIENLFADQPDAALARLGDYFRDWDLRILAVLRPQLDWLRSRHVENVLSGFRCSTDHFATHVRAAMDSGALDYRGRLAHLGALLGARQVRAIRFRDEARPLVPRCLEALGLPLTDPGLAGQIHANRREKAPVLIEAKRRLNSLTGALHVTERLELEHRLRQAAAQIDGGAEDESLPEIPLSAEKLELLQAGNDALLAEGILDAPLDLGRPGEPARPPDLGTREATDSLFAEGLTLATRIARQAADPARFAGLALGLSREQITAIREAVARHPVSLHLDAPESATLAACSEGRLVALLLPQRREAWPAMARLDRLETASPLIAVAPDASCADDPDLCLARYHLPPPGLVVAGGGTGAGTLRAILGGMAAETVILLGDARRHLPDLPTNGWRGRSLGDAMLLSRRHGAGHAAAAMAGSGAATRGNDLEVRVR